MNLFFNLFKASRLVTISIGMVMLIPAVLAQVPDKNISPEDFKIATENVLSNYYMSFEVANIGRVDNSLVNSYTSINGTNIYDYLEALTEISLQSKANGDVLWGRIQGGPYERKASEYVKNTFETWGLPGSGKKGIPKVRNL